MLQVGAVFAIIAICFIIWLITRCISSFRARSRARAPMTRSYSARAGTFTTALTISMSPKQLARDIPEEFRPDQRTILSDDDFIRLFYDALTVDTGRNDKLAAITSSIETINNLRNNPSFIVDCSNELDLGSLNIQDLIDLSRATDEFGVLAKIAEFQSCSGLFFHRAARGLIDIDVLSDTRVLVRFIIFTHLGHRKFVIGDYSLSSIEKFMVLLNRCYENPMNIHTSEDMITDMTNVQECPICLNEGTEFLKSVDCSHLICKTCVENCLQSDVTNCCLCKTEWRQFKKSIVSI
jgi:hypothetical protein